MTSATRTSNPTAQNKRARKKTSRPSKLSGWNAVNDILDATDTKVESLGRKLDKAAKNAEHDALDWIHEQADFLQRAEDTAARLISTARVKAHLGKMDATDTVEKALKRIDSLKVKIDGLLVRANSDVAEGLRKLSNACLALRNKLIN